jgi:hypothetical protein
LRTESTAVKTTVFIIVGATAMPMFSRATENGFWTIPGLVGSLSAYGVLHGTIATTRKSEST